MKPTFLLVSANYGNYSRHRLYIQNQETKNCFAISLVCCVSFFLAENLLLWVANKQTDN